MDTPVACSVGNRGTCAPTPSLPSAVVELLLGCVSGVRSTPQVIDTAVTVPMPRINLSLLPTNVSHLLTHPLPHNTIQLVSITTPLFIYHLRSSSDRTDVTF